MSNEAAKLLKHCLTYLILGIICLTLFSTAGFASLSPKQIYKTSAKSVFLLVSEKEDGSIATGTAFAITKDGKLLTAAHVIESSSKQYILNANKQMFDILAIEWVDYDLDLAILKTNSVLLPVKLNPSNNVEVGEQLIAISHPRGLEAGGVSSTLSEGLLSSIREDFISERFQDYEPIYDKNNPKKIKEKDFYKDFYSKCKQEPSGKQDTLAYLCEDGQYALMDLKKRNSIIYDNYDLIVNLGHENVYFFQNTNSRKPKFYRHSGLMLQYTVPISGGSSGGPLFDEKGEVIAVINSYLQDAQNVNYGRPVSFLPTKYLELNKLEFIDSEQNRQTPLFMANSSLSSPTKHDCLNGSIELNKQTTILKCSNNRFLVKQSFHNSSQSSIHMMMNQSSFKHEDVDK